MLFLAFLNTQQLALLAQYVPVFINFLLKCIAQQYIYLHVGLFSGVDFIASGIWRQSRWYCSLEWLVTQETTNLGPIRKWLVHEKTIILSLTINE